MQAIIPTIVLSWSLLTCLDISTADSPEANELDFSIHVLETSRKALLNAIAINPDIFIPTQQFLQLSKPSLEVSTHLMVPPIDLLLATNSTSNRALGMGQCERDLMYLLESLKTPWAIQMLDSFGKPKSGLMKGAIFWVGNYDECLDVKAPASDLSIRGFTGRFAWITISPQNSTGSFPAGLNIGACLPSSCEGDRFFSKLYKKVVSILELTPLEKLVQKMPNITVAFIPKDKPLSSASIGCICLCSIFVLLVVLGSLVDICQRLNLIKEPNCEDTLPINIEDEHPSEHIHSSINNIGEDANDDDKLIVITTDRKWNIQCLGVKFFMCFSAVTNSEAILDTSTSQGQLLCVHGIRFISMAWVILGHSYAFGILSFENLLDIFQLLQNRTFQVIIQGTYSVDTFFLLSGFLLTYLFLKSDVQLTTVKEYVYFYVHRYVRLTPVYAVVLFVLATWFNDLANGPFWNRTNEVSCKKSWWWNLLYINNFEGLTNQCMGWSWFLANDMQFYVISPIFLFAFKRNKTVGAIIVGVLLVASWIATGVICRINHVPVVFEDIGDNATQAITETDNQVFAQIYTRPYTRIGPYLIGVLLGFILFEVRGKQMFLNKGSVILGWMMSQALSLLLLYGVLNSHMGSITASAHNTLSRSAWAISVAWVIFACLTGHGGPVTRLLSWKGFVPLSRLTYTAYLVHPMVQFYYYNSLRTSLYFTTSQMIILYLGFISLSYGVAFITSLLFEAPIMKLEKLLINKN